MTIWSLEQEQATVSGFWLGRLPRAETVHSRHEAFLGQIQNVSLGFRLRPGV